MSTLLDLRELGRDDIATAGGKGANLGELIKAGFDVPEGFVLTTEVYAAALEAAQLSLPLEDEADPAAFREQVCRGTSLLSNGQLVTVDGGSGRVVAYQPER